MHYIHDVLYQHCVYIWDLEEFDRPRIAHDRPINVVFEWYYSNRLPSDVYTNKLAEMNRLYCRPDGKHPTNRSHFHGSCASANEAHDMSALHARLTEMVGLIFWWQLWCYTLYPALSYQMKCNTNLYLSNETMNSIVKCNERMNEWEGKKHIWNVLSIC